MFINPQTAIDSGWITGITNPDTQIQPNATDFTLDKLYTIDKEKPFIISEEAKTMRGGKELFTDSEQNWLIPANTTMDGQSNVFVDIPEGVAALLIIRSTFNRNGIFLTSGLYDSGFKGHVAFAIHNRSDYAIVKQGTRIGQIIFVESNSQGTYSGGYNHAIGTHHSE